MLPDGFELSQGSLQTFVDCKRRFQLRYLKQQAWPGVEIEPALEHEHYSIQGQQFHRLLERYFLLTQAMPDDAARELIETSIPSGMLEAWWHAFLAEPPLNLPTQIVLPEVRLVASLAGQRLVAVFDLLAIDVGERIVIVDWKTSRTRPGREKLLGRLQSKVYPVLMVESGAQWFGQDVDPARITMVYWFSNYPSEPHVFHYDQWQYESDRLYLTSLIEELASFQSDVDWPLVAGKEHCRFCEYRSLCDRGVVAGLGDFDLGDDFSDLVLVNQDDELEY